VRSWIRLHRAAVARRVLNHELPAPALAKPVFTYDPAQRFVGPNARPRSGVARLLSALRTRRS
jgi:hypothetical protein